MVAFRSSRPQYIDCQCDHVVSVKAHLNREELWSITKPLKKGCLCLFTRPNRSNPLVRRVPGEVPWHWTTTTFPCVSPSLPLKSTLLSLFCVPRLRSFRAVELGSLYSTCLQSTHLPLQVSRSVWLTTLPFAKTSRAKSQWMLSTLNRITHPYVLQ